MPMISFPFTKTNYKTSGSLLVYVAELTPFTCGILLYRDNLIYSEACEI